MNDILIANEERMLEQAVPFIRASEIFQPGWVTMTRKALLLLIDAKTVFWRDPHYAWNGCIDVEIKHPLFGWIPFTCAPNDVEPHGRILFWRLHGMGVAEKFPHDCVPEAYQCCWEGPSPMMKVVKPMTRRQLFGGR